MAKKCGPNGLAKKATEKVASDCNICVVGFDSGKKRCGKTSMAALA